MEAAQALADLTEISSQIEAAVIADATGAVVASTLAAEERSARFGEAAAVFMTAVDEAGREGSQRVVQAQAALPEGSVFVVRDDRHVVAAVTRPDPTVGLVFYDLKTCLRLVGEEPPKKPARRRRKKETEETGGNGEA